jgi:hypothetical protein
MASTASTMEFNKKDLCILLMQMPGVLTLISEEEESKTITSLEKSGRHSVKRIEK